MNDKVKGLDIGYAYTKDDEMRIFKSAITTVDNGTVGGYKLNINGKTSYIGVGNDTVKADKCNLELTKQCMLCNLWLDPADSFYIVSGLPIKQYAIQKDTLRESLMSCNGSVVNDKVINIQDVSVYPQCAGALLSSDIKDNVIVIDFGGHTIDVGYFSYINGRYNMEQCDTWYQGMLVLYSSVIDAVNNRFSLTLEPKYAEQILQKGLFIHGEQQDTSFLYEILHNHLHLVFKELQLHYPSLITKFALCGGGSYVLYDVFMEQYPNSILIENGQFANARGFKRFGDKKYASQVANNPLLQYQRSLSYAK